MNPIFITVLADEAPAANRSASNRADPGVERLPTVGPGDWCPLGTGQGIVVDDDRLACSRCR